MSAEIVFVFVQAMGDQELPGVLVSGFEGPYSICEDHVGVLQKHFNLITMQEFLENKTHFGPKIQAIYLWAGKPHINQELLQSLPSLRVIASSGVGLDHLDLKLIDSFGVKVANTPHAVANPTADLGMALLLAVARRVVEGKLPGYAGFPKFRWQILNLTQDKVLSSGPSRTLSPWGLEPYPTHC